MRASDHVLARLAEIGIDTATVLYGGAMAEMADALARQSAIKYRVFQHEQGAIFAAEGYAKSKQIPGLVIVTSGPGCGNIVTGLQNCFYDSTPLIAITGQVARKLMRPKGSTLRQLGFQETPAAEICRPITKYAVTIEGPEHLRHSLETAIIEATTGRPGPVLLDIPSDVQAMEMP